MRRNDRAQCPSNYIALDCETIEQPAPNRLNQTVSKLWFGWALYFQLSGSEMVKRSWLRFDDPAVLWDWVRGKLSKNRRTVLLCHWAGYDLTAARLWEELEKGRFRPLLKYRGAPGEECEEGEEPQRKSMVLLNDPPTVLDLQCPAGNTLLCVDTLNWWPIKLAEAGDALGVPKLPMPGEEATTEAWDEYCRRDVEIVAAMATKYASLVKGYDLGNWSSTVGSQSLKFFRHRGNPESITWGHEACYKAMERRSYYGMVCRPMYVGALHAKRSGYLFGPINGRGRMVTWDDPNVYRLDVNSCYPSVMGGHDYPTMFRRRLVTPSVDELDGELTNGEGVADVLIDSPRTPFPLRRDGKVMYAVGRFATTLCGPDLRRAIALGVVRQVDRAQVYDRGNPFDEWLDVVVSLKRRASQENDRLAQMLVKALANALHGKLAQRGGGWVDAPTAFPLALWGHWHEADADTGEVYTYRALGGFVQMMAEPTERLHSLPLISAYVTAYARELMLEAWDTIGERNLLYVDADSVHCTSEGYERLRERDLISDDEPGKFKVVSIHKTGEWCGPKHYRLGEEWTRAGMPKGAAQDERGYFHRRGWHRLMAVLGNPPPIGPISDDQYVNIPPPTLDGEILPGGWLDWPRVLG